IRAGDQSDLYRPGVHATPRSVDPNIGTFELKDGRYPGKGVAKIAKPLKHGIGELVVGEIVRIVEAYKLLRVLYWERPQHQHVDYAKNGRVCADPERQQND